MRSLAKTAAWYTDMFPSLVVTESVKNDDECKMASIQLPTYTHSEYRVETRFVENNAGATGKAEVDAFISYIEATHAATTGPNQGWDAWYDRHLGLLMDSCPLDKYMTKFFKRDVSFNPHGRASTTEVTDSPTNHVWTEGVEGFGLEMQGNYDFSFRDCYTVFDWCTTSTNGAKFCSTDAAADDGADSE